ncbi:TPA: hypothetical protein PFR81_001927 [Clostridioides difficile]|nr:hypothetical protein [Clostridioides difficile]
MVKDVKLKKGMCRDEVNRLLKENDVDLELVDEIYGGVDYKYNWRCECGEVFTRKWYNIKKFNYIKCKKCSKISSEVYNVKHINLKKYMDKYEVNNLLNTLFELDDEIYLGYNYKHNWRCSCGNVFKRTWHDIKAYGRVKCEVCRRCIKKDYNDISDVRLIKNMSKNKVNMLIEKWLELEDDIYVNNKYLHNWKCINCGARFQRTWSNIRSKNLTSCNRCNRNYIDEKYKYEVEKDDEYKYIRSFKIGERLNQGNKNKEPYVQVKHIYCKHIYETPIKSFINKKYNCPKCCGSYENSFAYHIEQELGEAIDKYWDFNKNTINPYMINKNGHTEIWIKCKKFNYHKSYKTTPNRFNANKNRCPYCKKSKVHSKDSFAQYHISNTDKDFLEKYWDYNKNEINPYEVSFKSHKKIWVKCQKKLYHESYIISCNSFTSKINSNNNGCPSCHPKSYENVHLYDSFGYNYFNLIQCWSDNNNISPFRISKGNPKKMKFICPECGLEFKRSIYDIVRRQNIKCSNCSLSEGEKSIESWINKNKFIYVYEKEFENLTGLGGGRLSYDFYLPEYKLLIEYQGEFHDGSLLEVCQTEEQYKKQQEHDRRKREYATTNGYELLEIWHQDFDNIEEILDRKIGSLL